MKKTMMKKIFPHSLLFICLFTIVSCADFVGVNRSFVDEMDRDSDGFFVPGQDFPVVAGDEGNAYRSREEISARTPLSEKQKEKIKYNDAFKQELEDLENNLSESEKSDYLATQRYLPTTSERIYYLKLSPSERRSYFSSRQELVAPSRGLASLNMTDTFSESNRDLYIGMDKSSVIRTWGKPTKVEIAGDPRLQNERWLFYEGGRAKLVYIESGKVGGWTLD